MNEINISRLVDTTRLRPFHLWLTAWCLLAMMADGFDLLNASIAGSPPVPTRARGSASVYTRTRSAWHAWPTARVPGAHHPAIVACLMGNSLTTESRGQRSGVQRYQSCATEVIHAHNRSTGHILLIGR